MSVVTICDSCGHDVTDGVELIADFLTTPGGGKTGHARGTYDYCTSCAEDCIMSIVKLPKFAKLLCTKIGIHHGGQEDHVTNHS